MGPDQGRGGGWARVGAAHPSFFLGWVGAPTMEPPKKIKNRNKNNYHNK